MGSLRSPSSLLEAVALAIVLSEASFVVTTVFLHRTLAHRAVVLRPGARAVGRVLLWVGTGIRPRQWVAVHRKHHAHTDEPGDPHSPYIFGFPTVQFGNVGLYRRVAKDPEVVARYARDLPRDGWDRWLFDHALIGLGLGTAVLVVVFGWVGLVGAGLYAVIYLLGSAAVNGVGHWWGKRPSANLATNNQWLAWIVAGEGLHNNHHAMATAPRLAMRKGEIDPGWWVVRLLVALRLAELRHNARVAAT
ncbi:MAG TPA: fatty acid desaturase [Acidimicrobiales bacterium]